ncbi:hypothetical protein [Streptomyces violaceus]|uniref:Uncharacterized protein n=1 Tax=Streptomyces violaceus TaxID=1936 RepID=A0ABY9U846_STRVL|nr:hypothetical protein [Streptomyces janthinus]WND18970.1 hypothetical protein RI060_17175 [Streptomyces janthinus]GGS88868.1 hypothetical protein GCM10010270_71250 [Streptomyces janthinus]
MIFFEFEADPTEWFPLPLHWTDNERDQDEMVNWAVTCGEIVHQRHKRWWRRPKRLAIADYFLQLAEAHPIPNVPAHQAFVYGGAPGRVPQPFYALAGQSEGKDRETELRMMVQATGDHPVRRPDISEFHSDRLGRGLRCLRYFGDSGVYASLNYGWWSDEHQVYATVRTVSTELDWLTANMGIFDDFARSICLNPNPE